MRKHLLATLATLALMAVIGCSGHWANNGGGGGGGQGRNRPRATEDETRQAFEKVMNAFAHKDAASINDMMSSSAIFIDPPVGPGVFAWSDARPALEKSFQNSVNFQLSNESGYRIGVERDLGWIATVYHIRIPNDKGGFSQADGAISMLFQKTEGGYKVLMLHASRFAPPPAAAEQGKSASSPASPKKK